MIRVEKLSKFYGGKRALGPASFEIEDGETVGFLGLNGAGKTTALRILACDLRPSGGTVTVGDIDALANPHQVRKRIGFLPESPPVYQDMSVSDYLHFAGQLRGMSKREVRERLPQVLELTHTADVEHEIIGHLSHGYRQRVGVGQAIIHDPTLLILDEPTRGLDPVQIVEMRNMIRDLKEKHTVLISSHILTEISQTCDRILVLGRGKIIASGTEQDLTTDLARTAIIAEVKAGDQVSPESAESAESAGDDGDTEKAATNSARQLLEDIDGVTTVESEHVAALAVHRYRIVCERDVRADVGRALVRGGYDLLELGHAHSELESTFLKLVQGGSDANN